MVPVTVNLGTPGNNVTEVNKYSGHVSIHTLKISVQKNSLYILIYTTGYINLTQHARIKLGVLVVMVNATVLLVHATMLTGHVSLAVLMGGWGRPARKLLNRVSVI